MCYHRHQYIWLVIAMINAGWFEVAAYSIEEIIVILVQDDLQFIRSPKGAYAAIKKVEALQNSPFPPVNTIPMMPHNNDLQEEEKLSSVDEMTS